MDYRSTRGSIKNTLNSSAAIIQGLAPDGGLFVPVNFPKVHMPVEKLSKLSYQDLAKMVIGWFFNDFSDNQISTAVDSAYSDQWDQAAIAPLSDQHANNYYLELFHGPTLAFKDIALQLLPRMMTRAVQINKVDKDIIILTATSGDTGTASMCGFSNQSGSSVIVFYPHGGVSPVQLKQMLGQNGANLNAISIEGNFDDAQTQVKKIFNDDQFKDKLAANGYQFSSANSMNIGRLVPQIVYYLSAYGQLVKQGKITAGDKVNFTVPTGNFGDILAGYYAKELGLPINKLICASDENNVLTDFFNTGTYDKKRPFDVTNSPAMDILVSSNLERLLFDLVDGDSNTVAQWMDLLEQTGQYSINKNQLKMLQKNFVAGYATQEQVESEIKRVYDRDSYVIDPHTAVASYVTKQYQSNNDDQTPTIIVSTASPYKFPETVYHAITGRHVTEKGLPAIQELHNKLGGTLTPGVQAILNNQPRPEQTIQPRQMEDTISSIMNLR